MELDEVTFTVLSVIPKKEYTKMSPSFTLIEYFPSMSVCTPFFVPLTTTFTPGTGPFSSETRPLIVFSWA